MEIKRKNDDARPDARIRVPRELFEQIQHAAIDCGVGISATSWAVKVLREALPPERKATP